MHLAGSWHSMNTPTRTQEWCSGLARSQRVVQRTARGFGELCWAIPAFSRTEILVGRQSLAMPGPGFGVCVRRIPRRDRQLEGTQGRYSPVPVRFLWNLTLQLLCTLLAQSIVGHTLGVSVEKVWLWQRPQEVSSADPCQGSLQAHLKARQTTGRQVVSW